VHSFKKKVCKYPQWHCIHCIYCFRKINHLVLLPFAFILWCTRSRVGKILYDLINLTI
jgi:hypothetical protein